MQSTRVNELIKATHKLSDAVDRLKFPEIAAAVYNPLHYARAVHQAYIERYGCECKKIIFLGINPGPFGMAQTGIPFGEIAAVRDFLKLEGPIGIPPYQHPKRPIQGFDCKRSEVSGQRLWGLFKERFGTADAFFKDHYVLNYCPLLFMEASGKNLTPDKLPKASLEPLADLCDDYLKRVIELLEPIWLIGVGGVVANSCSRVLKSLPIRYGQILHPSPANPQANKGNWGELATEQMCAIRAWK